MNKYLRYGYNDKVDDADLVNGLTVETAVPSSAVFTDDQDAADVDYDNINFTIKAFPQGAIDEIKSDIDNLWRVNGN